jgi:hypothetical protein
VSETCPTCQQPAEAIRNEFIPTGEGGQWIQHCDRPLCFEVARLTLRVEMLEGATRLVRDPR